MQVVVWTARGQRFAIDTRVVVEVVPAVDARAIPHAPAWIRGLMDYRGELLPLLDVRSLLGDGDAELRRACRIIIVRLEAHRIGLLVESVESVERGEVEAAHPGLAVADAPYLGPVLRTDAGMVQLIDPERLLADEHRAILFQRAGEDGP
ncbi:MAG: chemotaxis protein CheW [Planctomycetota bacterium]|jgi:chemotaxis-related protein WspB